MILRKLRTRGVAGGTRVVDIEIDHGVPSWSVVLSKTRYANIFDARRSLRDNVFLVCRYRGINKAWGC